jgi:hypothetical protein
VRSVADDDEGLGPPIVKVKLSSSKVRMIAPEKSLTTFERHVSYIVVRRVAPVTLQWAECSEESS